MRIAGIVVLFAACRMIVAQGPATEKAAAGLGGIVLHASGARIPEAVAELRSEAAPDKVFRSVTDSLGVYLFSALPAGEYDLTLSRPGFRTLTVRSIGIRNGEQRDLPALQLAATFCGDDQAVVDYMRPQRPGDNAGTLAGRVMLDQRPLLDESPPVPSANVTLLCSTARICATTTTDDDGAFAFWDLPPGVYSVRVEREGYYTASKPGFVVQPGFESTYRPIGIERCSGGNCDASKRPKHIAGLCD